MIPAGVFVAFLVGLVVEAVAIVVMDRRAIHREAVWWEELRAEALDHYGRVFDWERDL